MPLPLLLLGAVVGAVGLGLAAAFSDDDSEGDAADGGEETARNRRKAEETERRREAAEQKRRRRAVIQKDTKDALTKLAGRHEAIGRSPVPRLTLAMLEEALSEWRNGSKAGFRKARDLLMPVNPAHGSARSLRDIRALNEQLDALDGLSCAVSGHAAAVGTGRAITAKDKRIRERLQNLATTGEADDSRSRIADAVDHYLRQAAIDAHSPARIVACGLLCAGKSSLLNGLSERHTPEYFLTGGGRTTRDCKKLRAEFAEHGCLLIDTPGLDAGTDSAADDGRAAAEVCTADHLLFVHALATGELHAAEVGFLEALAAEGSDGGVLPGLTVVLTHAESYQEVAERLAATVFSKVEAATGRAATGFQTSATAHAKGVAENKPALIEFSGIPTLRRHISEILNAHDAIVEGRKKRMALLAERVLAVIESCAAGRRSRRNLLVSERREGEKCFDRAFRRILGNVATRLEAS